LLRGREEAVDGLGRLESGMFSVYYFVNNTWNLHFDYTVGGCVGVGAEKLK